MSVLHLANTEPSDPLPDVYRRTALLSVGEEGGCRDDATQVRRDLPWLASSADKVRFVWASARVGVERVEHMSDRFEKMRLYAERLNAIRDERNQPPGWQKQTLTEYLDRISQYLATSEWSQGATLPHAVPPRHERLAR